MSQEEEDNAELLRPRLYHLKRFSLEKGYGFNLRKEASDLYAIVENIEENSPAHRAGLRKGDILIEVNYYSVVGESLKDIIKLVRYGLEIDNDKIIEHEVVLLVVDEATYDYYNKFNIKLNSMINNLIKIEILTN
jgi:predicted metalloprotease with PDZ domain